MPILQHAKKKMRQDAKKQIRNTRTRKNMKEVIREFTDAVKTQKSPEELTTLLRKAYKVTDTSAKKNLIHENKAARQKSNLAKMLKTASVTSEK